MKKKKPPLARYPLIYVEWRDHAADATWQSANSVDNTWLLCRSIGWLLIESRDCVTLIGAICDANDTIGSTQTILKKDITKREVLYGV